MDNKFFKYEVSEIMVQTWEEVMINATEMAKPFGKQVYEWLRLPSTVYFISALEAMPTTGLSLRSEIVQTINVVGTWMHEDVALEFARWVNMQNHFYNKKLKPV